MSTISVGRAHNLGEQEALERAKQLVADFAGRLKADVTWNGTNASFKGTGFSGAAKVTPDRVAVDVDLGMLLRPMKGKIESRLEEALTSKFA